MEKDENKPDALELIKSFIIHSLQGIFLWQEPSCLAYINLS